MQSVVLRLAKIRTPPFIVVKVIAEKKVYTHTHHYIAPKAIALCSPKNLMILDRPFHHYCSDRLRLQSFLFI